MLHQGVTAAHKIINDPVWGSYDISPILPIINTREFANLAYRNQLGMTYLFYPSATHSRQAHSLGAYAATKRLIDIWLGRHDISQEEARALCVYAALHDIGHGPFSHVTEPLCERDNDAQGLTILHRIKDAIAACDVEFQRVHEFFTHQDPLYKVVHDKNIGMEKIDYLKRDSLHVGRQAIEDMSFLYYIYWHENQMAIDRKIVDQIKEIQDLYISMYKNVYLRKGSVNAQRMMQKMAAFLLQDGTITKDRLPDMCDFELLAALAQSKHPDIRYLFDLFRQRELFKEAIVLCHTQYAPMHRRAGKPIAVCPTDANTLQGLINSKLNARQPYTLLKAEQDIAQLTTIPARDILLVPATSPERFEAQDICVVQPGQSNRLKEMFPEHFKSMLEVGQEYCIFRICTTDSYREKLSDLDTAQAVYEYLLTYIKNPSQ